MFISTKYNCIFIHIPKTGGSSIHNALLKHIQPEHQEPGHYSIIAARKRLENRLGVPYIDGEYFTFCFVRNPWDRFISAYTYLKEGGSVHEHPVTGFDKKDRDRFISPYKTFDDFILSNSCGAKICTELIWQQHFKPQYKYILNSSDEVDINFIGKFENYYKDFDFICKRIGVKTPKLKHINKSHHKPYQMYYTDKTAEIIYNTYKYDIDYFGYSFNS